MGADETLDYESALLAHAQTPEFLNSVAVGLMLHNSDGDIVNSNKTAAELLGGTRSQLTGRILDDSQWAAVRVDGSPFPAEERPVLSAIRSGQARSRVIVGIDTADRTRRWLSVNAYPLSVDGRVEGAVSSFVDVTEMVQRDHLLRVLTEVSRVVMSATGEAESLQRLCDVLVEHGHYPFVGIGVVSNRDDAIDLVCAAGASDFFYQGIGSVSESKDTGRGPVGTAMRTGVTQVANDLANQSLFEPWRERTSQFGINSLVAIPFTPGGRRATLVICGSHNFAFDDLTVRELETITGQAEFAIEHVRAVERVATALDGTLGALGQLTETRDPYTEGHQLHVGALGAAIATHLGQDAAMVELVRQSGEVHDLGKIAVPAEILTRPGRLSALELEMVKTHTTVGADILSRASVPWPIAEVALQHHERLDGSGYPHGLLGDDIILPARIIAVADVVEAMTQHRPYRPALGLERALAEVSAGAGTIFDHDVVTSCLAVFKAGFVFQESQQSWGSDSLPD